MKGSVLSFAAALAVALMVAAAALAALPARTFRVGPFGGSGVAGTATVKSLGVETGLELALSGLPKGKLFRVALATGPCARRTSIAPLGSATPRPDGQARFSSLVRRNGKAVAFKTIADGKHVIAVSVGTKTVACGSIPA